MSHCQYLYVSSVVSRLLGEEKNYRSPNELSFFSFRKAFTAKCEIIEKPALLSLLVPLGLMLGEPKKRAFCGDNNPAGFPRRQNCY